MRNVSKYSDCGQSLEITYWQRIAQGTSALHTDKYFLSLSGPTYE